MTEEQQDQLFDLLTKKAVYGLDAVEQVQLDEIDPGNALDQFHSLEITAAAISMIGIAHDEPLPPHLFSKIATDAGQYIGPVPAQAEAADTPWPPVYKDVETTTEGRSFSWLGSLGWVFALIACAALVINIWFLPKRADEQARNAQPTDFPAIKTIAQMREEMIASTPGIVKANWVVGNLKDLKEMSGDVVWSDEKQAGYMRFRGLPVNDVMKTTYQLWIFDNTQDKATPIDGGTFDVSSDGEVVIPINAKLKAQGPEMFAITVEKPGGVVVSKREKMAAIAKV